jgi:hypothetical protein
MDLLMSEDMYVVPNPKKTEVCAPVMFNAIELDTVPPGA